MKEIDFTSLSLQDALDFAILVEEEAADRYTELVDQLEGHHTEAAADFFRFMVENEKKHGEDLRRRRRSLFGDAPSNVDSSMLFEVEAPSYEKVRAFMTARQALNVSLESEQKAYAFFDRASRQVKLEPVRDLFIELLHEEELHQELVRRQLASLPPEEAIAAEEFADEPVAQ